MVLPGSGAPKGAIMTRDVKALAREHPDVWIPIEVGEELIGKVVDVTRAYSDQKAQNGDGFYPLLTIEADRGVHEGRTKRVHAFSAVLFNEVMLKRPQYGERVRFTYQGEGNAKNGRSAPKLYRLDIAGRKAMANDVYSSIAPTDVYAAPTPARVPGDGTDFPAIPTGDDTPPF